jgi:hypothetical protein
MFASILFSALFALTPQTQSAAVDVEGSLAALEARVAQLEAREATKAGPVLAYDSGWVSVNKGQDVELTHDVGGDQDRYIVLFDTRSPAHGQNHISYGGRALDGVTAGYTGAYFYNLDTQVVTIRRATDDTFCRELRLRIITY